MKNLLSLFAFLLFAVFKSVILKMQPLSIIRRFRSGETLWYL